MNHSPQTHDPGVGRGRLEFKVTYNVHWEKHVKETLISITTYIIREEKRCCYDLHNKYSDVLYPEPEIKAFFIRESQLPTLYNIYSFELVSTHYPRHSSIHFISIFLVCSLVQQKRFFFCSMF